MRKVLEILEFQALGSFETLGSKLKMCIRDRHNGQMTGVGGTTTNVYFGKRPVDLKPSGTLTIENNNAKSGTFDAVITNITAPLGAVSYTHLF